MDEWQFLEPYWDGSSEAQRRQPPPANPAPAPGELPSFGYPTDTRFSPAAATLPNNLDVCHADDFFPESFQTGASNFHSTPDSWDAAAYSWPAQFSEQPRETVHDALVIQPHWDDFIASLQTAPTRPPSTVSSARDFSIDGYGIDILMADMGDEYSSLGFPSVPPSSIPDDDGYSSRPAAGHPAVHVQFRRHPRVSMTSPSEIVHHPYLSKLARGTVPVGALRIHFLRSFLSWSPSLICLTRFRTWMHALAGSGNHQV
ncbi:hypothetical protein B0H14DRAFT_1294813 [Mycena olivaceomarginata]|nr:hypothetical protein B0H14DRAFT_1294813 [Mycena olivaceomarginata]